MVPQGIVLGGVVGASAADEFIELGFDVEV